MKKTNCIKGYTYELSKDDVKYLNEFKEVSEGDFLEFRPSIIVMESGCRSQKVFMAFAQIGNCSEQLLFLPISNCTSVLTPYGEFYSLYKESVEGVAKYALGLIASGKFDWRNLINNYKKNRVELENILRRPI